MNSAMSMHSQVLIGSQTQSGGINRAATRYDFIIIKEKTKWKAFFDMMMNFIVLYNTIIITLQVFYEIKLSDPHQAVDTFIIEPLFFLDIIFSFLMEFKDPETQQPVREITAIMKNYGIKGSFIFDFVAVFPLNLFIGDDSNSGNSTVNKLFRMFRITRIAKLLDIQRVNHMLKSFFENDSS